MTYREVLEADATHADIHTVYLDMDGVIADFDRGWRERLGYCAEMTRRIERYDQRFAGQRFPWTFWEHLELGHDDFWGRVADAEFWASLPWTDDGREILQHAASGVGVANVYLLTHAPRLAGAYAGKFQWVAKHLPDLAGRLIMTGRKHLLARPGTLLIDDSDDNCESFRQHGGRVVQIPRPWNKLHWCIGAYEQMRPSRWFTVHG